MLGGLGISLLHMELKLESLGAQNTPAGECSTCSCWRQRAAAVDKALQPPP